MRHDVHEARGHRLGLADDAKSCALHSLSNLWQRQDAQNGVPVYSLGARKSRRGLPSQLPTKNPPHNVRRLYRLLAGTVDRRKRHLMAVWTN